MRSRRSPSPRLRQGMRRGTSAADRAVGHALQADREIGTLGPRRSLIGVLAKAGRDRRPQVRYLADLQGAVARERARTVRHDRAPEGHQSGFGEPAADADDRADLASQPNLAEGNEIPPPAQVGYRPR